MGDHVAAKLLHRPGHGCGARQLTCSQGFKNRHSPENRIGPVLSVSSKIDKIGTKFKSAKNLNGIDKPDKKTDKPTGFTGLPDQF
jgi:hypothetical protein